MQKHFDMKPAGMLYTAGVFLYVRHRVRPTPCCSMYERQKGQLVTFVHLYSSVFMVGASILNASMAFGDDLGISLPWTPMVGVLSHPMVKSWNFRVFQEN